MFPLYRIRHASGVALVLRAGQFPHLGHGAKMGRIPGFGELDEAPRIVRTSRCIPVKRERLSGARAC